MRDRLFYSIFSAILFLPSVCPAKTSVVNTVHNLSMTGPGLVKSDTEDRVCIFCHTPHNGSPATPLWNKNIEAQIYDTYKSSTLSIGTAPQPQGPSRLCLSCHDGTIALGQLRTSTTEISFSYSRYVLSNLGVDISNDHPVSFSYFDAAQNTELNPTLPANLLFYGNGVIHCSTCHDAHDDANGMFLRLDNRFSQLCASCHSNVQGWTTSPHSTSANSWDGVSGPNPWPHNIKHSSANQWTTVAENGCQNCHTPHNAGGPQRLMMYAEEEKNCLYACHNGTTVSSTDMQMVFSKFSTHDVTATTRGITADAHDPAENITVYDKHVECADCHNPHVAYDSGIVPAAPYLSSKLKAVSGVNSLGIEVEEATYEYEVCYKCHAASNQIIPTVNRVVAEPDLRLEFDTINPSFHPVVAAGKNLDVPSLGTTVYAVANNLTSSSIIYCTDCHDNDESPKLNGAGPKGPHGSQYAPLLRENYETLDGTPESQTAYALCYRCHDRQSLIDESANQQYGTSAGHYGHVFLNNTPCSICHDPHGVRDNGLSGSHTHLINFDIDVVNVVPGQPEGVPFFTDNGTRSGSCTLVCHGITHIPNHTGTEPGHVNSSYP